MADGNSLRIYSAQQESENFLESEPAKVMRRRFLELVGAGNDFFVSGQAKIGRGAPQSLTSTFRKNLGQSTWRVELSSPDDKFNRAVSMSFGEQTCLQGFDVVMKLDAALRAHALVTYQAISYGDDIPSYEDVAARFDIYQLG